MNIDKILKLFIPKDDSFFPMFEEDSKVLIKSAELLQELLKTNDLSEREKIIRQIKDVEHEGDDVTHKIFQQLNRSFITPFDREDIQELTATLDDVVDFINGIAQRIEIYKPRVFMPVFNELADIIAQCAIEIQVSIHDLHHASKNKDKIIQSCINLNTLENKADELHHMGLSTLFEQEPDAKEVIKNKAILETLEKTVDKAEDVSDAIKTILIKMA